jgi:hypothetical protein
VSGLNLSLGAWTGDWGSTEAGTAILGFSRLKHKRVVRYRTQIGIRYELSRVLVTDRSSSVSRHSNWLQTLMAVWTPGWAPEEGDDILEDFRRFTAWMTVRWRFPTRPRSHRATEGLEREA